MLYKPKLNGTEIDFPVPFFLADFLQQMQNTPKDSFSSFIPDCYLLFLVRIRPKHTQYNNRVVRNISVVEH